MILMIDDEPRGISSYKEELVLSGYRVVHERKVDDALRVLAREDAGLELVILDIMMPTGEQFRDDEAVQMGLRTGVRLYETIRAKAPALPVIILTNVSDPRTVERFSQERGCLFLQKTDCLPYELAEAVGKMLAPAGEPRREAP
jgi:DNA-binding NarL/FixJ family response regulator